MLDAALSHLRVTDDAEIPVVMHYLAVAREQVERLTGRAILAGAFELLVDDWGGEIVLDRNPVSSITSIKYRDTTDTEQTVSASDYLLYTPEDAAAVVWFRETFTQPSLGDRMLPITVTFAAGYAGWHMVPATLKHAVLLLATNYYEQRAPINVGNIVNTMPLSLESLLHLNRIQGFLG